MTKDEAWKAHVEEYDRDRFDSTSRHRRHCFDAGWEAALAGTLGMLEAIVHKGRYIEYMDGKQALLVWRTPTGRLTYQIDLVHVTRAKAEALLVRGEKKE